MKGIDLFFLEIWFKAFHIDYLASPLSPYMQIVFVLVVRIQNMNRELNPPVILYRSSRWIITGGSVEDQWRIEIYGRSVEDSYQL